MKTEIQETELYKKFIKALDIHDMRSDDNPFVVKCCEIAKEYSQQRLKSLAPTDEEIKEKAKKSFYSGGGKYMWKVIGFIRGAKWMREKLTGVLINREEKQKGAPFDEEKTMM